MSLNRRTPLPRRKAPIRRSRPVKASGQPGGVNTHPRPRKRAVAPVSRSESACKRRERDKEWKAGVLAGCGGRCERGCRWKAVDAHHVAGKQAWPRLRHSPRNGCGLCRRCHRWAHDNPKTFAAWFQAYRTEDWCWIQQQKRGDAT